MDIIAVTVSLHGAGITIEPAGGLTSGCSRYASLRVRLMHVPSGAALAISLALLKQHTL